MAYDIFEDFLERNHISERYANSLGMNSEFIHSLNQSYYSGGFEKKLNDIATSIMVLMKGNNIHSIRYRVKNLEHCIDKILRKKSDKENNSKYNEINHENYYNIIDDLIGIRILHLFKKDFFNIHDFIINNKIFKLVEKPIIFYKEGDDISLYENLSNVIKKQHKDSYRSVHYILCYNEQNFELQVRTLSEEVWSEIDHTFKYPNIPVAQSIVSSLKILNTVTNVADEIISFIDAANIEIKEREDEIVKFKNHEVDNLNEIKRLAKCLSLNEDGEDTKEIVSKIIEKINIIQNDKKKELELISDINNIGDVDVGGGNGTQSASIINTAYWANQFLRKP